MKKSFVVNRNAEKREFSQSYLNRSFLYGDGLFTSLTSFQGKLPFFDEHLERLRSGWNYIFSLEGKNNESWEIFISELRDKLRDLSKEWKGLEFYLRLMIWPAFDEMNDGTKLIGLLKRQNKIEFALYLEQRNIEGKERQIPSAIALKPSSIVKENGDDDSLFPKSPNYLVTIKELQDFNRDSAWPVDIYYLNRSGNVTEASTSNLFIIKEGMISTAPLSSGILDGIIRKNIIKSCNGRNRQIEIRELTLDDLRDADEIFLTNAVQGIVPVSQLWIDKLKYFNKKQEMIKELNLIFYLDQQEYLYELEQI